MKLDQKVLEIKKEVENWLNSSSWNANELYNIHLTCTKNTLELFRNSEYSKILSFVIDGNDLSIYVRDKEKYLRMTKIFDEGEKMKETKILKLDEIISKKMKQMNTLNKMTIARDYLIDFGLYSEEDSPLRMILENENCFAEFKVTIDQNFITLEYTYSVLEYNRIEWKTDTLQQGLDDYLNIVDKMIDIINEARYIYTEEDFKD